MKLFSRIFFVLLLALGTYSPTLATDFKHKFAELVIEEQTKNNLIGLSAAIILPDGSEAIYASGVTDPISNTPLTPEDLMLAGSVGKVLYSSVTLQLAQEGVLSLDEPISTYIGDKEWFSRLPNANDLTLRTLMNHTTGIPRHIMSEKFLNVFTEETKKNPNYTMTTEEIIGYTLDVDPLFALGEKMSYADTNYIIMEYVVEEITGQDFYDLIKERVISPLEVEQVVPSNSRNIKGLTIGNLSKENLFRIASPINKDEDGNLLYNPAIEGAGGGFAATPLGLARLAKGLYEKKLLNDEMFAQKMELVTMGEGPNFKIGYGLGVMDYKIPLGHAIGHSGFFPGYRTDMFYFPEEKVAVAVMINSTAPVRLTQIALGLADQIMKSEGIRQENQDN